METVTKLSSSQSFQNKNKKKKREKSCWVKGGGGGGGGGGGCWWGLSCSSTVRSRFSKSVSFLSEGETFIVFFWGGANSATLQALDFSFFLSQHPL